MNLASWRAVKLGELVTIKHGYAFKGEYFGAVGSHIVLTPGNFFDAGGFKHKGDKEKWYSGEVPNEYILSQGDFLVAMTEQAEGLLGSSAIVPESDRYLHNQRLGLIRNLNGIDKLFLYYLFNSPPIRQQIRATCSGVKVRHTSPSRIYEVNVSIPVISVQRKIAAILSAYDVLIENNLRRIKILEEMAQNLYREWFIELRFPGHQNVSFADSALGPIPEGWSLARLDTLATIKGGKQLAKEEIQPIGRFPVYGGNGIQGFSSKATHQGFVIAFGRVGAYCGSIHWSYGGAWLNNNSSSVVPIAHDELILQHLLDFNFANLRGGAAQPFISNTALAGIELLIPDEVLADKFCFVAKPQRLRQANLEMATQTLRRTRNLLLPKLISGELDVSELGIAVPEDAA